MLSCQQPRAAVAIVPEAMTSWQRRTLLAMLVGFFVLLSVAFNSAGPSLDLICQSDSAYLMLGGMFAQASLLAVWAALGQQPLTTRVPRALGIAALLGLAASWGATRHSLEEGEGFASATFMMLLAGLQAVLLIPWRRYFQWQIRTEVDTAPSQRSQFSLKQLLLWTTAAAVILAVGRAIGLRNSATFSDLTRMAIDASVCVLAGVLCLPIVIPSLSLLLGKGKRGRAAVWLAVATVISTLALLMTALLFELLIYGGPWTDAVQDAAPSAAVVLTGFLATLLLSLLVARSCGFRLSFGADESAASEHAPEIPAAPLQPEPARWRRSQFASVVAALALVVGVLAWPAWRIEQERRENLRRAAIYEEWNRLGVDVNLDDENRITSATFDRKRPVSDVALDKLTHSPQADGLYLLFSNTSLADDQMQYLAGLKNANWLLLDGTQITDAGLVHLRGMNKLRILNLNGTRVSDEGLKFLEGMDSLEQLGLNDTKVSDAGLIHLRGFSQLKTLGLARTRVTDRGLQPVEALPKLELVLLQGTSVTAAGLARVTRPQPTNVSFASSSNLSSVGVDSSILYGDTRAYGGRGTESGPTD